MDVSTLPVEQQQLYKLLIEANNQQTNELKTEYQQTAIKIEATNQEVETIKKRCIYLERKTRKNNIVIFGIQNPMETDEPLKAILGQLNSLLEVDIKECDINNFYTIGKTNKPPVVLEFISFLKKQTVFQKREKLKELKKFGVSIANDLCLEDKEDQKILRTHLKIAKSQNDDARIVGYKLIVNNKQFTVEDLKTIEKEEEEGEGEDKSAQEIKQISNAKKVIEENHKTCKPVVERKPTDNYKNKYRCSPKNTRSNKK